jgi:glycosyltransferase involved in cell wall biosynthesis
VWAISRYTLERLRALAPRNKVHGIVVIPVDIARFHPGDRFAWLRSAGPVRLGVSGRLSDPRKGLPLLLDAFRRLVRSGANAVLQIRGDVSTDDIRHGFDLGDIGDRLDVAPAVPASGLPDFLRGLDVFVLPSHQEGLSQIAAEAMACGCCVVSTRCGGPEEFVLDGETGLLADIEPGALAHRLEAVVADADLRQTLGQAGAAYIRERYAPPIFEQQFVEAFASVYPDA